MLKLEQYQKLKLGDQVRYSKEIYTCKGHEDFETHRECKLVSDDGLVLHNGIYIIHLMAYHGAVDVDTTSISASSNERETPPLVNLLPELSVSVPEKVLMPEHDQALFSLYWDAEAV